MTSTRIAVRELFALASVALETAASVCSDLSDTLTRADARRLRERLRDAEARSQALLEERNELLTEAALLRHELEDTRAAGANYS